MPKSLSTKPTFYPAYCFSLSPTYKTWARLNSVDVHALKERSGFEGQSLYFHTNHPIQWIRLVGVIVALDVYPARWIMILDDSSGATIEVTCALAPVKDKDALTVESTNGLGKILGKEEEAVKGLTATGREIDLAGYDVGYVVKVKGGIGSWRGEKQVTLERIATISTTNEEAAAWVETTAFRKDILDKPWVVSEKDETHARKKAEGGNRERKAMEERKRKKTRKREEERRKRIQEMEKRKEEAERDRERILELEKEKEKEKEKELSSAQNMRKRRRDEERAERERLFREMQGSNGIGRPNGMDEEASKSAGRG